jgi:hypothetical protein
VFLILASLFYLQGIVAFTYDDQIASRMEKQQATVTSDSKGVINEVLEVCNLFHVKPFEKMFLLIRTTPFYTAPHRLRFFQHSVHGFYDVMLFHSPMLFTGTHWSSSISYKRS